MKKLLYIALMMVLAGTLSCHRTSDVEARLIAIDSLIGTAPDSALVLLEEISPSEAERTGMSMAGEDASRQKPHFTAGESPGTKGLTPASRMTQSEHAYHALLTVQALYKAYIPATSDSLINLAWDYYKDHGPYDRRIRAMLYKGTTAEELGQPDTAMFWYKRCENEIKHDDFYNRGFIRLRMAYLYQFQYIAPEKAIELHKKSYQDFIKCNNSHYQLVCLTELGMIYRLVKTDSAAYYAYKAINLAKRLRDNSLLFKNYESIAGYYIGKKDWKKALFYSMEVVNSDFAKENIACYHFAAQSYLKLGLTDSAWQVFRIVTPPFTVRDSVLYYRTLSDLLYSEGNYKESAANADKAGEISANAVITQSKINYTKIEDEFENKILENDNKRLTFHVKWLWVFIVLIIVGLLLFFFHVIREYKKFKFQLPLDKIRISEANNEIRLLSEQLERQQTDISNNISQNEIYRKIIDTQSSCTQLLFNSTIYSGLKGASIFKYIFDIQRAKNKSLVRIKLPDKFWDDLNQYAMLSFPNAFNNIKKAGISLSDKEKKLILLDCLQVPNAVIAIILDYAEFSTASMRNRLITKLGETGTTLYQIMKDKSS